MPILKTYMGARNFCGDTSPLYKRSKKQIREELAIATRAYLENNGVISVAPPCGSGFHATAGPIAETLSPSDEVQGMDCDIF